MKNNQLKVIELFAGIGAPRKALMRGGYNFKIVDAIEIDKYAVKSYNAIYNDNIIPKDVCEYIPKKEEVGDIDLIITGSPCQDFSAIGKQAGGDINSGTRSSLMYENIRIIKELKPKYVIWENVKNLLSKKHIHNFNAYLEIMENLGYKNYYKVLNSKDYGVPQFRERIFTISIRNDIDLDFEFPQKEILNKTWKDFVGDCSKEYVKTNKTPSRDNMRLKCKNITNEQYCMTITLKQDRWPNAGIIDFDGYFRFLSPMEQWLLMGFDKEDYLKCKTVQKGYLQLQKQAGNSIVVNVLEAIFNNLLIDYK